MAFDECPPPLDRAYNEIALARTHAWAERCRNFHRKSDQALFGIAQGGIFPDLRESSARFLMGLDFPGYAIGGLAVGESKEQMHAAIECVNAVLPENKPRYLMGVGSPEDLVNGVLRGVDIFDWFAYGWRAMAAMTRRGRLNMKNTKYARDHGGGGRLRVLRLREFHAGVRSPSHRRQRDTSRDPADDPQCPYAIDPHARNAGGDHGGNV